MASPFGLPAEGPARPLTERFPEAHALARLAAARDEAETMLERWSNGPPLPVEDGGGSSPRSRGAGEGHGRLGVAGSGPSPDATLFLRPSSGRADARLPFCPSATGRSDGGDFGGPGALEAAAMAFQPVSTLGRLFPECPPELAPAPVAGLTSDSRAVAEGDVFVALPGSRTNGAAFIADALANGASAVVGEVERPGTLFPEIPYLQVADARRALALAAARLHPGQPETTVAVTGTSGKSSVADFVRQIFAALGRQSASLGTLGIVTGEAAAYGSLTTPDPITLHRTLDELARGGVTHLAMEASSHGLDQRRLDGVRVAAAAFTNLGRDHLDYHPTVEDYLAAKMRLFAELLPPGRPAVVNADGAFAGRAIAVAEAGGHPVLTAGRAGETLRLASLAQAGFAQRLTVGLRGRDGRGRDRIVDLPLVGAFQVENALVAAGLVLAVDPDLDPASVVDLLADLRGVPGRLERVGETQGALCVVDYAHKPDALAAVLDGLRPFARGRLVCVFGCGGDRDRGKRPLMGAIAAEKADLVIVTDDNPRTEEPGSIRAAILAAAPGAREIGDRGEAIRAAVDGLGPGDVLVVAGKGHETGQIVGDRVLPFSDRDAVAAAIRERAA